MLYDEFIVGLDLIMSGEINVFINQVQEQYYIFLIIIMYDFVCVKDIVDRVIMLLDGKFVQIGIFEEVFFI